MKGAHSLQGCGFFSGITIIKHTISISTFGMISVQVPALFVVENLLVITIPNTHVHTALFFNRPLSLVGFVYPIQIMYDS